ncbi:MAG: zinc dependent phospholipase C family protein [Bacillota bacterium]
MPDIWTHLITGDRIATAVSHPEWSAMIHEHRRLFDFGCQGPDFFLYYNFWPWCKDKRGNALGDMIHHVHCGAFFEQVFLYVASLSGSSDFDPAASYGLGLLCHWALDRATHPYIHYIAGSYTPGDPNVAHLAGNHKRIEAIIDTILVKDYWKISTSHVPANQRFDLGRELPPYIAALYRHVVPRVYPEQWQQQAEGFIEKSYRDMMSACRVLFDPTGIKKKVVTLFQRLTGSRESLTSYFYPEHVNASVDYLNHQHRPWCHPVDCAEISQASFNELMDQAVTDGIAMVNSTIAYLTGQIDLSTWRRAVGNLSFSTGRDCDLPLDLKYAQPILE